MGTLLASDSDVRSRRGTSADVTYRQYLSASVLSYLFNHCRPARPYRMCGWMPTFATTFLSPVVATRTSHVAERKPRVRITSAGDGRDVKLTTELRSCDDGPYAKCNVQHTVRDRLVFRAIYDVLDDARRKTRAYERNVNELGL